ncbi:DUF2087 domain-containing protein [Domibacillus aminovorans]|uniref:DUF2087 domain-containing protein n=1 Tax=Domibacillus aminovorans TaxID=29332 RepID=A0A177L9Y3_9BACI|nr:hypothetical protein AWH49_12650 [Domibacillus aminovorans]
MEISDSFWNASLAELKQGYIQEKDSYICLLCGKKIEKGIIYPYEKLKQKERQAKTFLAIMELLKEKDEYAPAFIPPHKTAKMVDDRYAVTEEEQQEIIKKFLPEGVSGRLKKFPTKEKQRLIVLREITKQFESDVIYTEKEINQLL